MNERLRSALAQRGITEEELAAACSVDPKTVSRWVADGRMPHQRHRRAAAKILKVDIADLWPDRNRRRNDLSPGYPDLITIYPNRASVPRELWLSLLLNSTKNIDILVFAGTFISQTNPSVAEMLKGRAESGVEVRLCFGDPECQAVFIRGHEEGIGNDLSAKVRASLRHFRSLPATPGCEIRLHNTTLYNSIFRYDDEMMINPHIWGQQGSANPTIHIRRAGGTEWFSQYAKSFEAVWHDANPWSPKP